MPARYLLVDDASAAQQDVDGEGDPLEQARALTGECSILYLMVGGGRWCCRLGGSNSSQICRKMMYTIFALGTAAILSSVLVISAKNPVHSVLALVAAYGATCGIMVQLGVEFMALLFMIVYVGAIAILFLFVVMMLNIKLEELKDNATRYVPIGFLIGFVFIVEVLLILESDLFFSFLPPVAFDMASAINPPSNIIVIGQVLYTDY